MLWLVCFAYRNTPSPTSSRRFPSISIYVLHSLTHFSLFFSLFFPFLFSPLHVCMFPPLPFFCFSPPTRAVWIPARRGGGVCDPDKDQTFSSCSPSALTPFPGKMGAASSLPGHQLSFKWAARHGSRDLAWFVCLLLRICTSIHPPALLSTLFAPKLVSRCRSGFRLLEARRAGRG